MRRIAAGGMAEVWLARRIGLSGFERRVVLKRMLSHLVAQPAYVEMFLDEARLGASLHHQNIVQTIDVGHDPSHGYFLAMELLEGVDVLDVIEHSAVPLEVAAWIAIGAAAGLHHAHELSDARGDNRGVVHRDVSPSNLFVTSDGVVKLLDFGIARDARRRDLTGPGAVRGKLRYVSPEQARGEPLDRRSDVFSLGVVLHELVTGQRFFVGADDPGVLHAILHGAIAPPSATVACPPELDAIVLRALARDRSERFQTAAELGAAIEGWCRSCDLIPSAAATAAHAARVREHLPQDVPRSHLDVETVVGRLALRPPLRRRYVAFAVAYAALVLAVGLATAKLLTAGRATPAARAPAESGIPATVTPTPAIVAPTPAAPASALEAAAPAPSPSATAPRARSARTRPQPQPRPAPPPRESPTAPPVAIDEFRAGVP